MIRELKAKTIKYISPALISEALILNHGTFLLSSKSPVLGICSRKSYLQNAIFQYQGSSDNGFDLIDRTFLIVTAQILVGLILSSRYCLSLLQRIW